MSKAGLLPGAFTYVNFVLWLLGSQAEEFGGASGRVLGKEGVQKSPDWNRVLLLFLLAVHEGEED